MAVSRNGVTTRMSTGEIEESAAKAVAMSFERLPPVMSRALVKEHTIYFIEAVGADRVKIGRTQHDIVRRLRQIQTSCPFPVRLLGTRTADRYEEWRLHQGWNHLRVMPPPSEWFHLTNELREHILNCAGFVPNQPP
ncbi:MAG TPA: GIY-YIG nuclease family protein [Polyangiaceae bacterium]